MVLQYSYAHQNYMFDAPWTDLEGNSTIFLEIMDHLEKFHGEVFSPYRETADQMDQATDKLYQQIYIFGNEYQAIPYNPKHRRQFLQTYEGICTLFDKGISSNTSAEAAVVSELFSCVLDKLQEIVGVYLLDNSYQSKHQYRRRKYEEWAETLDEGAMSCEFESVLIQMTDLSRLLEKQLTEKQRERLVKHIFLNYTLQEIADQEGVALTAVAQSITAALKKLRSFL